MTEYCPRCDGVLLLTSGTRETFRMKCQICGRVWDVDDDLKVPAGAYAVLLILLFLLASLVEVVH